MHRLTTKEGRHEHACPAIVGSGPVYLPRLGSGALPFIGALGASLSLRAGGNTRDRLLTALGSAWLNGGILTLGVPLSMIIERHFSLSIKLTAYIVYMIAWCLVPAVLLALGALPWLGRKATMRARGATGL
jgi:hypothetical protein